MPIVLKRGVGGSTLSLWHITESEEQLQRLVTAEDRDSANQISDHNRRVEHLAARAMVRMISPTTPVVYSDVGAPMLSDGSLRLGLAHTEGVVALITNRDKLACAVDIESTKRSFDAASRRYISIREDELSDSAHPHFRAVMWCAKETMYKYSGRTELNLLEDIEILELDIEQGRVVGEVSRGREWLQKSSEDKQLERRLGSNSERGNGGSPQSETHLGVEDGEPIVGGVTRVEMGLLYYEHYVVVYTV